MPSYIEYAPVDVLQHIAFLCATFSIFGSLSDLAAFLLTSRIIYNGLCLRNCPQLYADIFRIKYDTAAIYRRLGLPGCTDTGLASELVRRCQALQCIRRAEVSGDFLMQTLCSVYRMILESDGLNELQLEKAGFSQFIAPLIRNLCDIGLGKASKGFGGEDSTLALWLFWLSLKRGTITSSKEAVDLRDQLLSVLRPFLISALREHSSAESRSFVNFSDRCCGNLTSRTPELTLLLKPHHDRDERPSQGLALMCPDIFAICTILIATLQEELPPQIPLHLPQDRAAALASQRSGPTLNDYYTLTRHKTPLLGDSYPATIVCPDLPSDLSRSLVHDHDFYRLLKSPHVLADCFRNDSRSFVPGSLSGLWEGTFMVSPPNVTNSSAPLDFINRQPMQCFLRETLPFGSSMMKPRGSRDLFNGEDFGCIPSFAYAGDIKKDNLSQLSNIIVTGETLEDHGNAWGAFTFSGNVRLEDGLVRLQREPKGDSDFNLGCWYFEGFVHTKTIFLGRWSSSRGMDNSSSLQGIFCLNKRDCGGRY